MTEVIEPQVAKPSDQPFEFTTRAGTTITVPSVSKIDPSIEAVERYENEPNKLTNLLMLVRSSVDAETADVLRSMRVTEFRDFLKEWGNHSGISLGESLLS